MRLTAFTAPASTVAVVGRAALPHGVSHQLGRTGLGVDRSEDILGVAGIGQACALLGGGSCPVALGWSLLRSGVERLQQALHSAGAGSA